MIKIDGKKYREELLESYKKTIEEEGLKMRLDIIQVGDRPDSLVYAQNKMNVAKRIGIETFLHKFSKTTTKELCSLVRKLNDDEEVTGIILESPIEGVDFNRVAEMIDPIKDVDGFTSKNVLALYNGHEILLPCTVLGIIKILDHYDVDLDGKEVTIIGRGKVGKPLSLALTNRNATVTLCHTHTIDLKKHTSSADIVVTAAGCPKLLKGDMIKDGAIVIDVGMNRVDGKWCGDVDMESMGEKPSLITPVPGGVGPMTVAMIMENLILAERKKQESQKVK